MAADKDAVELESAVVNGIMEEKQMAVALCSFCALALASPTRAQCNLQIMLDGEVISLEYSPNDIKASAEHISRWVVGGVCAFASEIDAERVERIQLPPVDRWGSVEAARGLAEVRAIGPEERTPTHLASDAGGSHADARSQRASA